jgi:hypothetical protein
MVTQEDVLQFIAAQATDGRAVGFERLTEQFGLSTEAACDHLQRLWRDRLIAAVESRPPRFQYRVVPGEKIRQLSFRIAPRGRERLKWYRRQAERESRWLRFP